jgi:hypothetical protein
MVIIRQVRREAFRFEKVHDEVLFIYMHVPKYFGDAST